MSVYVDNAHGKVSHAKHTYQWSVTCFGDKCYWWVARVGENSARYRSGEQLGSRGRTRDFGSKPTMREALALVATTINHFATLDAAGVSDSAGADVYHNRYPERGI